MRRLELRRHAPRDPDEDKVSHQGGRLAEQIGRGLRGPYAAIFTSTAKRAAETAAFFLSGLGQKLPENHLVTEGLASQVEDRWRTAAKAAGTGRIGEIVKQDEDLVREESGRLADAIRELLDRVPEDATGLAIGHSPLIEAAVYGLTGDVIEPLKECEGVLLEQEGDEIRLADEYRLL